MRTSTTTLLAAAFVLPVLVSSTASAAAPATISALPDVPFPEMLHPKDSPASLPATESIEGVQLSRVKHREFGTILGLQGRCVTMGSIAPGAVPSGNSSAMIRASSSALPLRVERFVGADTGKPELEIVDGWVDMTSGGMREERTTHIPLISIGKGPSGYSVYGFRSDGKVHAVFPTPQRFAFVDSFGKLGFVDCQHTRLTIDPTLNTGSLVRVAGLIQLHRAAPKVSVPNQAAANVPVLYRGIEATVSVSKIKRDREPLLSVTVAWNEDEPMPSVANNAAVDFEAPIPQAVPVEAPSLRLEED